MLGTDHLDEDDLVRFLGLAEGVLTQYSHLLDALNVFPVADSDTGKNVVRTVKAAHSRGSAAAPGEVIAAVRDALFGHASGNSGVILSEALSGALDVWTEVTTDGGGLAAMLRSSADAAHAAVGSPVEGTMITVLAAAADSLDQWDPTGLNPGLGRARDAAHRAVLSTPDQLAVLAEAGVVDSGGLAAALVLDALLTSMGEGSEVRPPTWSAAESEAVGSDFELPIREQIGPRYEVLCTVLAEADSVERLADRWTEVGESLAVAGRAEVWRVHLHTDRVDLAIELAREHGTVEDLAVTDLFSQMRGHLHDAAGFPTATLLDLTEPNRP